MTKHSKMDPDEAMTSLESLDSFGDVGIDLEAQMDLIRLTVRQILELEHASVIKLSRSVGENLELLAGGAVVGQGEIVAAHGRAAIRIAEFREED